MFTAALLTNSQEVEATQIPTTDEWISNMWSIHTMEYYSALKSREILAPATTWVNLEDIKPSEII